MAPRFLSGIAEIAAQYRHFLVDLWGCVHDGVRPYPGALDCLERLRAGGGRVLFLSNAPRPGYAVRSRLANFGVPDDCFDGILSSGDATVAALNRRDDAWHRALGRRYFHLGPERSAEMIAEIEGEAVAFEAAEYLLATGLVDDDAETVEDYRPLLARARERRLPMVCANPDLQVMRGPRLIACAGALAEAYEAMGGEVRRHGKPYPSVYAMAFERLGAPPPAEVLAIGDGLFTDIAGARAAGIDSVWLAAGIHGSDVGYLAGQPLDEAAVAARLTALGAGPTMVAATLAW